MGVQQMMRFTLPVVQIDKTLRVKIITLLLTVRKKINMSDSSCNYCSCFIFTAQQKKTMEEMHIKYFTTAQQHYANQVELHEMAKKKLEFEVDCVELGQRHQSSAETEVGN